MINKLKHFWSEVMMNARSKLSVWKAKRDWDKEKKEIMGERR